MDIYILSRAEGEALNKSLDYSLEKYIDYSYSSDCEEEIDKPELKLGRYLEHCTFVGDSVNYFVPVIGKNKILFTQGEMDEINKAQAFGYIFPDDYDKELQIWIKEGYSEISCAKEKGFELFYDLYKPDSILKSKILKLKRRDLKCFRKLFEKSLEAMHLTLYWKSKNELQNWILKFIEKQSFESYNWSSFDQNKKLFKSFYSIMIPSLQFCQANLKFILRKAFYKLPSM